jgi:hypothetical protein
MVEGLKTAHTSKETGIGCPLTPKTNKLRHSLSDPKPHIFHFCNLRV